VLIKNDKSLRRYATTVERALGTWETVPEEWADYIAFLSRLLRAIQGHGKDASALPHSSDVASKLSQCLNPALPSGVHQKALEVYTYIFATFGREYVTDHLHAFLPGLSGVLSFASLSTRPGLYDLLENYIVRLDPVDLRPIMKSLVLSVLPALEDETSEDFEQALSILAKLESTFVQHDADALSEDAGYFWQCLFLAVITSPSRRQGALNYLTRRLPSFAILTTSQKENKEGITDLSHAAEAALTPESGLLIRCFVCGLSDPQPLIQRGFLDLLVTHLPLSSPVLQERVMKPDFDRLTTATVSVLLRRDMSLNRRVWTWLLGPEAKDAGSVSPSVERNEALHSEESQQFRHFATYGQASVQRCLTAMLEHPGLRPVEKARPFRICLSLMDRWEIGGPLVPRLFLPAMKSVHAYSTQATREEATEAIKSASLFFDGTESRLIWSELFKLLQNGTEQSREALDNLHFFRWIVQNFNVREEEMLTLHIPLVTGYLLDCIASSSGMTVERLVALSDCATTLLELIPARAFVPPSSGQKQEASEVAPSAFDIRRAAKHYYERWTGAGNSGLPSSVQLADLFVQTSLASLSKYMTSHPEVFAKIVQIMISLLAKIPKDRTLPVSELAASLCANVESSAIHVMQYSTVSSAISLLAALLAHQDGDHAAQQDIQSLEIALLSHLWHYLSPTQAKHHVEAVRLIWHLDDFAKAGNVVRAGINELMQKSSSGASLGDVERVESICRFTTLWTHTLPLQPVGSKTEGRGVVRRGSSMITNDAESWSRRIEILSGPLLLCLDTLHDSRVATRSVVRNLLGSPNSIGLVFQVLFTKMTTLLSDEDVSVHPHEDTSRRVYKQKSRELEYVLEHLLAVLTLDDEVMWQGLGEMKLAGPTGSDNADAVTWLATQSIRLVGNPSSSHALNELAASILRRFLNGPYPIKLRVKSMSLEDSLLRKVRDSLALSDNTLQTSLLELTVLAMGLRQLHSQGPDADSNRRRLSLNAGRRSSTAPREEQAVLQESGSNKPPSQLLDTLREGFASLSSRVQMDAWLDFLAASLPIFGDMLLTNLIPLVDTFCDQLRKSFDDLKALSDKAMDSTAYSPDTTILKLLEGLNMLLAEAHDRVAEEDPEPQRKASAGSQSVLGSMASSAFKSQAAPPSRSAKANSRLTVILAFQDAIRMCIQIWTWSAGSPENDISDRYNAATTSYYTYRMRNRTRSMLEQMFSVEPLESLEVVMTLWSQASNATTSSEVLSLLHVLPVSRPKSVVPAILDALCSRTYANHMSPSRQSSLTSDLSAADVVAFFTAYLETVEDDATDEIWPDCTAFMRDVLANPLPFRSILPALLWVTLILAEKLDNTNFGDQRKMRRELGDQFSRLLSATFAASPINSHLDANGHAVVNPSETDLATGRRNMDVVVILRHVVAKIESILDSVDRITTVVNTISTSVISPAFHARSFPSTVTPDILGLLARMTKKAPTAKSWRREVLDAFNSSRILDSDALLMEQFWFPVLQQWSQGDKERVHDLLTRLAPPSSAGIMFGVGAAAARLKADGETQFVIRRLCLLLLASPTDSYAVHMQLIGEKLVELFQASMSSSPSAIIKAELFMLCRALVLSTSPVNVAPLWPIINDQLQAALSTLAPQDTRQIGFTNLSLLQAGKLLDLLVSLSPDEFQLYEWLYVTDTTDAVYHPPGWTPTALADQLAEHLGLEAGGEASPAATPMAPSSPTGQTRKLFGANLAYDKEDIKAMAPEDFAKTIMRPFLSQLSINAYESTYSLEGPDAQLYRRSLLEDILDSNTLVDHER
jgi:predicted DNA-binding transcriptional regulator YafY